ncbi:MAG: hypothetical protein HY880_06850, partial [Deltaproteobacteria bacterium]|nr:hypothetical protein [Deltaproteobacteria bacterium]
MSLMTSAIYVSIISFCIFYGLVFSMNWKLGVALFALIAGITANFFNFELGLIPIIFLIPFDRLAKLNPDGMITFAKVFIGFLIIAFVVKTLAKKDNSVIASFKDNPVLFFSLLFIAFSLISIYNVQNTDIFLMQIVRRVSVVAILFLLINVVTTREMLTRIFNVFLLSYFFVGITGIYEMITGLSILKVYWGEDDPTLEYVIQGGESRVAGPSGDPDFHAIALVFPAMIAVTFFYLTKGWVKRAVLS